jgi:hypothetical protein
MNFGMERLYAAAKHFGPACKVGDVAHDDAGFAEKLRGATGRKNFDAQSGEPLGELHDTCFIEHADERALHRHEGLQKKKSTTVYALGGNSESVKEERTKFEIRNSKYKCAAFLGFDEGFELYLAFDDFDDVLDIATVLLFLKIFGFFQNKFVEAGA